MADQRSVMKEYRLLDQKRQAGGLTPQEEARFAQLRELVGSESGVAAARPGFDVNAAAARLRESLLPAGLRNRPPPDPLATPVPPPPEPEPAATPAAGLEAVWDAAPFAPLTDQPAATGEALFDPGTLGLDNAWDAAAPPAEGSTQPYDPNAPQQWDAGATQGWDAAAQGYDPNAQPYDPNAQPYDPNAPQQWDAGATQGWDAAAPGYDPNAQPYDPNAQPYDPNAPQQWDAGAQGYDPNAQPYDPNAQPWDPNAVPQWDAAVQPAWDPNLAHPWDGQPTTPGEEGALAAPEGEPSAEPEPEWSAEGASAEPIPDPANEAEPLPSEGATEWDSTALPAEPEPASEVEWASEAAGPEEPIPEVEWTESAEPPSVAASLEPEAEPLTEASEPVPEDGSALPFDVGAASALAPSGSPEGWGSEEPSVELGASAPEPALASDADYGDLAGPEEPSQVDALSAEEAGGLLAPLGAGQELTSDDDAFAQGFHLESNGSFGKEPAGEAQAWAAAPVPVEGEEWESAPALDLGAMAPVVTVPPLDLGPPPAQPSPAGFTPAVPLEDVDVEEIPVVEGSDLLEELPPTPAPPLAPPPPPSPPPARAAPAAPPPPPAPAADVRVEGVHRVVVHTLEGLVKRGVIADVSLDAPALPLMPQPGGAPEPLPAGKVKAIFFMLAAGEKPPVAEGKKVRVTFNDGRQIAGFSPDYSDAGPGFFMIPADTRTNTGRIWVYRAAVKTVSVT